MLDWPPVGEYNQSMSQRQYLALDDAALLGQCDVNRYKASGPGGQHRNKVTSAVRLVHRPTCIAAGARGSRSQHENRRLALQRLRMNIACKLREPIDKAACRAGRWPVPTVVSECIFTARGGQARGMRRLAIGRKDHRFWDVAASLLDLLEAFEGRLSDAAKPLGITASNLAAILQSDRHLLGAAQEIRRKHGCRPIV